MIHACKGELVGMIHGSWANTIMLVIAYDVE